MEGEKGKLELIAIKSFAVNSELVKVVDFLNKALKSKDLMFGISKDKVKDEMIISVYEV